MMTDRHGLYGKGRDVCYNKNYNYKFKFRVLI